MNLRFLRNLRVLRGKRIYMLRGEKKGEINHEGHPEVALAKGPPSV
jgi:hypothetical protein